MGMSRSAVLVAAYLMIFHHMTILEALMTLRKKRAIYPNDGFIMQLRELNEKLLEDREYFDKDEDDDDDKNSQGSVIEARAHSIAVEEEDTESVMGAKVHSIMVEEEDTTSVMGSAMSMMGKSSVVSKQPTLIDEDEEEKIYEEWRRKQGLPPKQIQKKENGQSMKLPEDGDVSGDYVQDMIYNWQKENAKYQSLELSEDGSSLMSERRYSPSEISDVESITSQEIRMVKQQFEASRMNRMTRGRTDSVSTDSTWDMWNQRLLEIEKEVKSKNEEGDKKRVRDIDEESLCSEAGSLFNFCKNNKHKLTALERWKVKRIQFGYHKKDSEAANSQSKEENGEKKEDNEMSQSDVDLTAYQAWKLKQQKKVGNENKEEIVELAKGEDTATVKRRQRRAEILERSKQNLEESQSMCGWDNESSMSGSLPLSAFFQSAPSSSGAHDTASVLSMQSNRSRQSQAKSSVGQAQIPTVPPPNILPGPVDAISIASIQNWIQNVVTETIAQKQNKINNMSRAPSVLSMANADRGRKADDETSSVFGGGSCISGSGLNFKSTDSVLTYDTSMSSTTNLSTAKRKITETSVPLYGLFMDDVDLKKLNQRENEMREELDGKLAQYRKEKVESDNKRSYNYRKKKAKDTEDDKEEKESISKSKFQSSRLSSDMEWNKSSYSKSLSNTNSTSNELQRNVSTWLSGVKAEDSTISRKESRSEKYSRKSEFQSERNSEINGYSRILSDQDKETSSSYQSYRETNRAASRFSNSSEEETSYVRRSRATESEYTKDKRTDSYSSDQSQEANGLESFDVTSTRRPKASGLEDPEDSDHSDTFDLGAKRKFTGSFRKSEDDYQKEDSDPLEDHSTGRWSRYRKSKEEAEEMDDDDIIAAWRNRQEQTKAKLRRHKKED